LVSKVPPNEIEKLVSLLAALGLPVDEAHEGDRGASVVLEGDVPGGDGNAA
jgi:hypothetical protein